MWIIFRIKLANRLPAHRSSESVSGFAVIQCGLLKRQIERCARLLDRGARLQSPHYSDPPVACAHEFRTVTIDLRFPTHRDRDIHRRAKVHCAFETWSRYPRDGERHIIEIDLSADDVSAAPETFLPVSIADDCDRSGCRVVIRVGNHPSEKRPDAQYFVVIARDGFRIGEVRQAGGIDV